MISNVIVIPANASKRQTIKLKRHCELNCYCIDYAISFMSHIQLELVVLRWYTSVLAHSVDMTVKQLVLSAY